LKKRRVLPVVRTKRRWLCMPLPPRTMKAMNWRCVPSVSIALMVSMSTARTEDARPAVDNWALSQRYAHEGVTVWVPGRGWSQKIGHFYLTFPPHRELGMGSVESYPPPNESAPNSYRRNLDDFLQRRTPTLNGYDAGMNF